MPLYRTHADNKVERGQNPEPRIGARQALKGWNVVLYQPDNTGSVSTRRLGARRTHAGVIPEKRGRLWAYVKRVQYEAFSGEKAEFICQ